LKNPPVGFGRSVFRPSAFLPSFLKYDFITKLFIKQNTNYGSRLLNISYLNDFKLATFFEELDLYFNQYRKRLNKQNIIFKTNLNDNIDDIAITTDQSKLRQIFVNLLSNALKFTESGKIEAGCFQNSENQLVFFVSDTGIGIPEEKHNAVFERFVQIEYDASRRYGGAGLGLAIVKELLNLFKGEIWIESELGKGSTFNFIIPLITGVDQYTDQKMKMEKLEKKDSIL